MLAFIDFEASSLARDGYPIEVAWAFEDGTSEAHLIRPAPEWTDWDPAAEAIHHIPRDILLAEGEPCDAVAQRMIVVLSGHSLHASAPSWDGKWLSRLLRAAGLPRHALRLRDSEEAQRDTARSILAPIVPDARIEDAVENLLVLEQVRSQRTPPRHRALADAMEERQRWLSVRDAALEDALRRAEHSVPA